MNAPDKHLVFDVGGTQLRAALWDTGEGRLSQVQAEEAPSYVRHPELSWEELRARLVGRMSSLRQRLDPAGGVRSVAVAFPGPVDREHRIAAAPTLWGALGSYPYDLGRELRDRWPETRIRILNDVSAAGFRYSSEIDEPFCIVTVSTGIGSKVFVGGRPLIGSSGCGGEIGHLQIDATPEARVCDCGGRGHLGAYASGRGLVAWAREDAERDPAAFRRSSAARAANGDPGALSADGLAAAYLEGDPWASRRVALGAGALGGVLAAIAAATGVERFVLVGGFGVGLGPRFAEAVRAAAEVRCGLGSGAIAVKLGETDGRCALVGAGRAAGLGALL